MLIFQGVPEGIFLVAFFRYLGTSHLARGQVFEKTMLSCFDEHLKGDLRWHGQSIHGRHRIGRWGRHLRSGMVFWEFRLFHDIALNAPVIPCFSKFFLLVFFVEKPVQADESECFSNLIRARLGLCTFVCAGPGLATLSEAWRFSIYEKRHEKVIMLYIYIPDMEWRYLTCCNVPFLFHFDKTGSVSVLRFEIQRTGKGKIAPVGGNLYFMYEELLVQKMKLRRRVYKLLATLPAESIIIVTLFQQPQPKLVHKKPVGIKMQPWSFKSCTAHTSCGFFKCKQIILRTYSSSRHIEHLALGTLLRFDCLWGAWNTTTCPEPQHLGQLRKEGWKGEDFCRFLYIYIYICVYLSAYPIYL